MNAMIEEPQWYVQTPEGQRVVWAPTADKAKDAAEYAGHRVLSVMPGVALDLGWINGWPSTSEYWVKLAVCKDLQHVTHNEHDQHRHISRTTCYQCSYTYQADTSG